MTSTPKAPETPQKVQAALSFKIKVVTTKLETRKQNQLHSALLESCGSRHAALLQLREVHRQVESKHQQNEFLPKRPDLLLRPWHPHTTLITRPGPSPQVQSREPRLDHNQTERERGERKKEKKGKKERKAGLVSF